MNPTFSILMTTYVRERPERLARALESMFSQTLAPDQLVLAVDGPVGDDQNAVIAQYEHDPRIRDVQIVRLPANVGLGLALDAGFAHCTSEWVMRMDSDDISMPERARIQMAFVSANPAVDMVTGWSEEFFADSPETRLKTPPADHDSIVKALKWRNVLVHPSACLRVSKVREVGGYRGSYYMLEDWDLWVRMAQGGARFAVIQAVVVRMLVGREMASRRGGMKYIKNEIRFRTFCWKNGFLNFGQYLAITMAYAIFRSAGPSIRGLLYHTVRKPGQPKVMAHVR